MELFWSKVDASGECWLWVGTLNRRGYGHFPTGKRHGLSHTAHRSSWIIHHGPIPEGLHVLHRCDNPSCVNPDHLFLGTHRDNMKDMKEKGRAKGPAKLTETQVRGIRSDTRTHRAIAKDYGITYALVGKIKRKETWKHL